MGSCGSWEASMSLRRVVSLKQTNENTSEEIQNFINKNNGLLVNRKDLEELKKGDILLNIEIYDEDKELVNTVLLKDLGLENIGAKKFMDDDVYKKYDALSENGEDDEYYTEPDWWIFGIQVDTKSLEKKLKFINLKLLQENLGNWSIDNPNYIYDEKYLADCSDYIYCGNDNSDSGVFKITQKFIDSLSVGDELVVRGSGDGEHC